MEKHLYLEKDGLLWKKSSFMRRKLLLRKKECYYEKEVLLWEKLISYFLFQFRKTSSIMRRKFYGRKHVLL